MDFGEVSRITTSRSTTRIRVADPRPEKKPEPNLHDDSSSFGMVYVNELARKAYSASPAQPFPIGSILVREKLIRSNSEKPQVLTVMIKREKGFNTEGGDWSFLAMDGAATKVLKRKKKGDCLECHQSASDRDFVFELK